MKTTINDFVTIYPTFEGWDAIHTAVMDIYDLAPEVALKKIEDQTVEDEMGYRDQLHNIMELLVTMKAFNGGWHRLFRNTYLKHEKPEEI